MKHVLTGIRSHRDQHPERECNGEDSPACGLGTEVCLARKGGETEPQCFAEGGQSAAVWVKVRVVISMFEPPHEEAAGQDHQQDHSPEAIRKRRQHCEDALGKSLLRWAGLRCDYSGRCIHNMLPYHHSVLAPITVIYPPVGPQRQQTSRGICIARLGLIRPQVQIQRNTWSMHSPV